MTSSGGTLAPEAAATRAASLALSGPAGGVVGARLVGAAVGLQDLLTLDMGGTSADASLVTGGTPLGDGGGTVAGLALALPAVLIETVSAGGGSIARVDEGGALKVGPESAGAIPGPACYGRGGERPTVTDACLALRWLDAPHPLADAVRLDRDAAERALRSLESVGSDPPAIAAGIVAVATAVMARALKRVSVARGLDPRRMALLPFGGAGPLFGCQLAEALGMRTIVIPPHPGALSALGLASAAERVDLLASFHRPLEGLPSADLGAAFAPLLAEGRSEVPDGALLRYADCRFAGQGYEVTVPVTGDGAQRIRDAFLVEHRARFGHAGSGQSVELVNLRVVALREGPLPRFADAQRVVQRPGASRPITWRGSRVSAAVWALDDLAPGVTIAGPAILAGRDGASVRRRVGGAHMTLDAVGLEVMGHAFASVAEEMGLVLIHSAVSPNIRERRDCSAALFDAAGEMIAQAAHIPVHLGAMHESVAAVRALVPAPRPGDVFILNDPYTGGSHLPDITLIRAIEVDGAVGGYSVVRAHHSDVGGVQAGSMPAGAREILAEGVIVPPLRLTPDVEHFLLANVRTPETRRADLAAQRAAVTRGAEGLRALAARYGWAGVRGAATDLLDYAERRARDALGRFTATALTATDWLEGDGVDDVDLAITVRVDITDGVFHVDFTGTAQAARGNVNCPLAVARSAVLFVVRTLLPGDIPPNGGVQRAVRVAAPLG